MKRSTKNAIVLPVIIVVLFGGAFIWYCIVLRPQYKVATHFLRALNTRNAKLLQETVAPEEYEVYKNLYLKNGFNKHLLTYSELTERDANNHFFPSRTRFSTEVKEDDTFFGVREQTYFIMVEKTNDRWWVIQFSSHQDREDLKTLKQFKPPKAEEAAP